MAHISSCQIGAGDASRALGQASLEGQGLWKLPDN